MMGFENLNLRKEALSQGASTGDAKLAGLPGKGTLQVWRGQREDVLRIVGTWRLEDDSGRLGKVREALADSKAVVYDGVLDDPAQADKKRVRAEVYVTSIGSYQRRTEDGRTYCFVNFVPSDPEGVAGWRKLLT
ncbi:MAG: hypothetical protein WD273_01750 [Trueperaceae bacterium]